MPPTVVQTTAVVQTSANQIVMPFSSPVTDGNVVIVFVAWDGNDNASNFLPTVADSAGQSYVGLAQLLTKVPPNVSLTSLAIFATQQVATGSLTVTVTRPTTTLRGGGVAIEVSGLNFPSIADGNQTSNQAATGTTLDIGGPLTTTEFPDLVVAFGASLAAGSTTFSVDSGFTINKQGATALSGTLAVATFAATTTDSFNPTFSGMANGGFNSTIGLALNGGFSISGNCGWPNAKVVYSAD